MKRTVMWLMTSALAIGCGGGGSMPGGQVTMNPQTQKSTCSASLMPATFEYQVDDGELTLTAIGASERITLPQVTSAHGARPIYGTWSVPIEIDDQARAAGIGIVSTMKIEADRITVTSNCTFKGKKGSASATSPAEITDDTVSILEADAQNTTITYP